MSSKRDSKLSVVSPVFNNANTLKLLVERVFAAAETLFDRVEYVLVVDGSPDNSAVVLKQLAAEDPRIKVIVFAKNFGQHTAAMAGFEHSDGDYVWLIDADLEEPPEALPDLLEKLNQGFEISVGIRTNDRSSLFKRLSAKVYTSVYNALCDNKIVGNVTNMRLMTRRYVNYTLQFTEKPFIGGFCSWIGLPMAFVPVEWHEQERKSSYNVFRLLAHARLGVISFSGKLIRSSLYFGLFVSTLSIGFGTYIVLRYFLVGGLLVGYSSLAVGISFLMGILYILLGVIGEYIYEIFLSTRGRPRYLIYETCNLSNNAATNPSDGK